jgi:ribosome recycling factor
MPMDDILLDAEERMEKAAQVLETGLRTVRSGRASRALVEHIKVDYYGAQTLLLQLANIGVPEPQLIVIRPFDPTCLGAIEKAILKSDIGINPQNDGKLIRLALPPLSEERRRQLAAQVKNMGEETKVALRNVRRDANKVVDQEEDDSVLSEDDARKTKHEIQELIKQYEEKVDTLIKAKTAEIMTV